MEKHRIHIVILAAGKGTRMKSSKPKVLHTLAGKTLISHVLDSIDPIGAEKTSIVVGHGADQVRASLASHYPPLSYVSQTEQLGTGHAVQQVAATIDDHETVLIVYGDVPLIQTLTLQRLIENVDESHMSLLTVRLDDPSGYGRIVRGIDGSISEIVEQKDAHNEQLSIDEINTGVMAIRGEQLKAWLLRLGNTNSQGEYYLTDIIAMAAADGVTINSVDADNETDVAGVNDRRQQAALERAYQQRLADKLLQQGVSLLDPSRFDCRGTISAGEDCEIDINCVFEGTIILGNNVKIGAHCFLKNVTVGDDTHIQTHSVLENSLIGSHCDIGPFARIRPGTQLANNAKIGNFVEVKNANIGEHSKVNHLSYVGDADIGRHVNIGAGTITCNYDGANKHLTTIQDNVFVGSNSALVAPVTLGEGSTIGAGSTINQNVEAHKLAVTRAPQRAITGWTRPTKNK